MQLEQVRENLTLTDVKDLSKLLKIIHKDKDMANDIRTQAYMGAWEVD